MFHERNELMHASPEAAKAPEYLQSVTARLNKLRKSHSDPQYFSLSRLKPLAILAA